MYNENLISWSHEKLWKMTCADTHWPFSGCHTKTWPVLLCSLNFFLSLELLPVPPLLLLPSHTWKSYSLFLRFSFQLQPLYSASPSSIPLLLTSVYNSPLLILVLSLFFADRYPSLLFTGSQFSFHPQSSNSSDLGEWPLTFFSQFYFTGHPAWSWLTFLAPSSSSPVLIQGHFSYFCLPI